MAYGLFFFFFFPLRLALFFMWDLGYSYDYLLGQKPWFILLCQLIIICRYFEPFPFYSAYLCTLREENHLRPEMSLRQYYLLSLLQHLIFVYSFEYICNKNSDFYSTNRGRCLSTSKLNEIICSFFFPLVQGRKKKISETLTTLDWAQERDYCLKVILQIVELDINRLWDPPVAEEEFIS